MVKAHFTPSFQHIHINLLQLINLSTKKHTTTYFCFYVNTSNRVASGVL